MRGKTEITEIKGIKGSDGKMARRGKRRSRQDEMTVTRMREDLIWLGRVLHLQVNDETILTRQGLPTDWIVPPAAEQRSAGQRSYFVRMR